MAKGDVVLIVLAIIAALLAAVNAFIAFGQISDLARLTGYQVSTTGIINLTIPQNVEIYFSIDAINWSNGSISPGFENSSLMTSNTEDERVIGGTWTNDPGDGRDTGLRLENIGNINVSITMSSSRNRTTYFYTPTLQPSFDNTPRRAEYSWNLTNFYSGSCGDVGANDYWPLRSAKFFPINITEQAQMVCRNLTYHGLQNAMRIDVLIVVPQGVSPGYAYNATITAIGTVSAVGG